MTINNEHPFSHGNNGFQISPRLQELMVYAGQMDSYANCNEVINEFISVKVSSAQVYRVAEFYGSKLEGTLNNERILEPVKKHEVLYAQADGSMIQTREDGWNEVKLGRIFKSSDCIHCEGKQGWVSHSQYLAHLGGHKTFCSGMDNLLDDFGPLKERLVFITDGAVWLKNWIEDSFPDAVSILDFYHATEHLHDFSSQFFKDKNEELQWTQQQRALLLESKTTEVITNIINLGNGKNPAAAKLVAYFQSNLHRMNYKKYQQIGCGLIGSGAIESAHRTVIQKRMKQSGQRWSIKGAQHMLNLRVAKKNQQWDKIIALTKTEIRKAA
ncbi:MAG: UPF0236 family protein [Ferruginibacter sp.]